MSSLLGTLESRAGGGGARALPVPAEHGGSSEGPLRAQHGAQSLRYNLSVAITVLQTGIIEMMRMMVTMAMMTMTTTTMEPKAWKS